MNEIDKRRAEWLALEGALTTLEGLRDIYPLDPELSRGCYVVQVLVDKAEQRHFDAAIRLSASPPVAVG